MTCWLFVLVTSMVGVAPVTVIVSATPPTFMSAFTVATKAPVNSMPCRMTVEKRGDAVGSIAWRFITSSDQIDTVGAERVGFPFDASQVYYWRAVWGFNDFRLTINEGGVDGNQIYSFGKGYSGLYDPNPHVVYIGSPQTRSGSDNQSIPDMVIRQLWVSSRPRPPFAKK